MKKLIVIAAAMIALNAADATAQSFMKKVGKAVEKEAAKEVVSQINKGIANQSNKEKESKAQPKKSQQTQTKQTQTKQMQAKQSQTQKAPQNSTSATTKSSGQKKYVKNIDLYYKIGRVEGNYKLFYDGSHYYLEKGGKEYKLTPCDGEFMDVKYYFFCVEYGVELYIKEQLPGAVGKRVVKNDHHIK